MATTVYIRWNKDGTPLSLGDLKDFVEGSLGNGLPEDAVVTSPDSPGGWFRKKTRPVFRVEVDARHRVDKDSDKDREEENEDQGSEEDRK